MELSQHIIRPQTSTWRSLEWPEFLQLCIRKGTSAPRRGHLSDDSRVETLLQSLLVFAPAVWLIFGAAVRIVQLRSARPVVLPNRRGILKVVATLTLFGLQLAHLVSGMRGHGPWHTLAPQLLSLVAAVVVIVLSPLEHGRNVGPSTLLTTYLLLATFSDVIQAGLLAVAWNLCNLWGLTSAIFAIKVVLLALESQTKRSILREPFARLSPEQTAGFLGVAFFWWVNDILKTGYSKVFSLDDIPPLDEALNAMKSREMMQQSWEKRSKYPAPTNLHAAC